VIDEARHMAKAGVEFGAPSVDLERLRAHKAAVVGKLTSGLAGMAKSRKVQVVRGYGHFLDAHHVEVELTAGDGQEKSGGKKVVRFEQAIVAAGAMPVRLPFLPEDRRIVGSTGALALPFLPKRMLVIGGGIIGMEMATVYSTLGARIDVVEMLDGLMTGADRDLVKIWQRHNDKRFERVMLRTKTIRAEAADDGIRVWFDGENAPDAPQVRSGIIGMEMATVYSTLGARIDVVEMLDGLMTGADRDLVKIWQRHNDKRFERVMLRTKTIRAEAADDGIRVWFDGENAPDEPQV